MKFRGFWGEIECDGERRGWGFSRTFMASRVLLDRSLWDAGFYWLAREMKMVQSMKTQRWYENANLNLNGN